MLKNHPLFPSSPNMITLLSILPKKTSSKPKNNLLRSSVRVGMVEAGLKEYIGLTIPKVYNLS